MVYDLGGVFGDLFDSGHSDTVLDIACHLSDSRTHTVATAGYDSRIILQRHGQAGFGHILKEHSDAVYGLAFSPDGKLLASVSADRAMKVFDVEKASSSTRSVMQPIGSTASPGARTANISSPAASIKAFAFTRPSPPTPLPRGEGSGLGRQTAAIGVRHEGPVLKVVFSSDSKTLSVGQDRIVKAWDIERMVERKVYDQQAETVLCLALARTRGRSSLVAMTASCS